jgi:hypothetical protein
MVWYLLLQVIHQFRQTSSVVWVVNIEMNYFLKVLILFPMPVYSDVSVGGQMTEIQH